MLAIFVPSVIHECKILYYFFLEEKRITLRFLLWRGTSRKVVNNPKCYYSCPQDDISTAYAGIRHWERPNSAAYGLCESLYERNPVSGEQAGSPIADTFAIVARKNSAILVSSRFAFTILANSKFFLARYPCFSLLDLPTLPYQIWKSRKIFRNDGNMNFSKA
jgi:hypothetical protein